MTVWMKAFVQMRGEYLSTMSYVLYSSQVCNHKFADVHPFLSTRLHAYIYIYLQLSLSFSGCFISCSSTTQFNSKIKAQIVKEITADENCKYEKRLVTGR